MAFSAVAEYRLGAQAKVMAIVLPTAMLPAPLLARSSGLKTAEQKVEDSGVCEVVKDSGGGGWGQYENIT